MGDPRNDTMLPVPVNIPGPSVQATLVGDSGTDSVAIPGRPSADQLLWVTLEWLAQSESLQFIVPEAVPAGFTGCSEHSNRST